jgi:hypothetical protein
MAESHIGGPSSRLFKFWRIDQTLLDLPATFQTGGVSGCTVYHDPVVYCA